MIKTIEKYFTVEQWDAYLKFQASKFELELKQAELEAIRADKSAYIEVKNAEEQLKLEEIALLKASAVEPKA